MVAMSGADHHGYNRRGEDTAANGTSKAVQLVREVEAGGVKRLEVCSEGLEMLAALKGQQLHCVCVAGLYRSGKSFLLNQLLDALNNEDETKNTSNETGGRSQDHANSNGVDKGSNSGFPVGNTTESCTRGIWMCVVNDWIVLDSEGLASLDQDETHDTKIFCLGLLLSSYFLYNSTGVIDESALDRLYMVGKLAQRISKSNKIGFSLCWVLRDFALSLEKFNNDSNAYFEDSLQERGRRPEQDAQRAELRRIFRNRQCRTLVRPVWDERDLQRLAELGQDKLRPEFVQQLNDLVHLIREKTKPKSLSGQSLDGPMLGKFLEACLTALNDGAVPDIKKTFEYVAEQTYSETLDDAERQYTEALEAMLRGSPPASWFEFVQVHESAREAAMRLFFAPGALETTAKAAYMDKLRERSKSIMEDYWRRVAMASESRSKDSCAEKLTAENARDVEALSAGTAYDATLGPEQDKVMKTHLVGPIVSQTLLPKLTAMETSIAGLETALQDSKARTEEAKEAYSDASRKLQETSERLEQERNRVEELQAKAQDMEQQATLERAKASETIAELREQGALLRTQLDYKEKEIVQLNTQVESLHDSVTKERDEVKAARIDLDTLSKTASKDREKAASDISQLKEQSSTLRVELESAKREVGDLTSQLNKSQEQLQEERTEVREVRAELNSVSKAATADREKHIVEKATLTEQCSTLQREVENFIRQTEDLKVALENSQQALKEKSSALDDLQTEHTALQSECENLQKSLANTEAEANVAMKQLQEVHDVLIEKSSELEKIRDEHDAALLKMAKDQAEAAAAIQYLEDDNHMLRDDIDKIVTAAELERQDFEEAIGQVASSETRVEVEAVVRDLVQEVEVAQLQQTCRRLQEEREGLSRQLQDFHLRASTLPDFYQEQIFVLDDGHLLNW
mmetsp:Transcript_13568/g.26166  ORF Transcript_13568/g.26166 Transcript_13568/m.26166 type:complete len:919 (-) Transcript_13568:61-2817(-)